MPTVSVGQSINPFGVDVCVEPGPRAYLDLGALPRLEPSLLGSPVAEVPTIVKRLCGICPTPHHLAGIRALESLLGGVELTPTAHAVRELLHHGSVIDTFAPRLVGVDRELAILARRTGTLLLRAAGCPGHFPDVAVVGGVRAPADSALLKEAAPLLDELTSALSAPGVSAEPLRAEPWPEGVDLNLEPGPLGTEVVVRGAPEPLRFPVEEWPERVRESRPGSADCRPDVRVGSWYYPWRTGPALSEAGAGLGAVRASCEALRGLLARAELYGDEVGVARDVAEIRPSGVGVGVVEGPRGLLAHVYEAEEGTLVGCQILTPTAQNAAWLESLLTQAVAAGAEPAALERAIRLVDPCLPCTHAPAGMMEVHIHEQSGRR
ncbi:nickel-dependent hydrogenase large subunit [Corynebacterium uropygiale]|uniref:Nickel-dependent hydrogenase large subunit n=1 Tax=Corynebacterium uropygiale TaxID=1775911 RepID=A0A9X1TYD8_9CORY|nr:nickel-dependent hydrogenase large subunit [Corynebacterium uropygiale]MCF4007190.1 nickel-dependent hydrogenase large subunit [Corynebacterium uropygiale]